MKVTVIFGETRVVVPCGQGDFLVSELIEKAVVRYRKAAGKTNDHYVHIHTLKSHSDGGILDLDDLLSDVVDDREQIIAEYEEQSGPSAPQGGDGTSGSSVGSASPDAFQSSRKLIPPSIPMKSAVMSQPMVQPHRSSPSVTSSVRSSPALYIDTDVKPDRHSRKLKPPFHADPIRDKPSSKSDRQLSSFPSTTAVLRPQPEKAPVLNNNVDNRHSVEVTEQDLNAGTGLQVLSVRRDSEPNIVSALEAEESLPSVQKPWAHLPEQSIPIKPGHRVRGLSESSDEGSTSPGFNSFARDSSRQSLTGQNVLKWASAQERQQDAYDPLPAYDQLPPDQQQALQIQTDLQKHGRREPLGQSQSPGEDRAIDTRLVVLKNEDGPLGIHVVPHQDQHDRESGLAIQGVEPGGRVHRSGQIQINDVIVEINGNSLRHTSFTEAQEIFRNALQTEEIRVKIFRPTARHTSAQDTSPISPKPHGIFKSVPPPPPQRSPNTALSNQSSTSSLPRQYNQLSPTHQVSQPTDSLAGSSQGPMQTGPRKLGKKLYIELTKGPEGLGFSITTRDNPAGGLAPPIYVKNILPKGAAIVDGRLKSGDRLLEVNNMDMTGKSQNEVVAILRNTKRGSTVTLCISRLDSSDNSSSLPRQMPKTANENVATGPDKKVHFLNIPLNETGSAGLGISVKGKTTSSSDGVPIDLGIFIKAVIHGGAASKDGRLQINDQLLSVNDDDLKKKTNSEAMETLRKAMHTEGPMPGHIKLTVERKTGAHASSGSTPEAWDSSTTTDSTMTGRNSTDGGVEILGNKIVEVTLSNNNERKLSTTAAPPEATLSPTEPVVAHNVIDHMRNPVLDRITGSNPNKLSEQDTSENESYQIATQEDSEGEDSYDPPTYSNQSTIPTPTQPHTSSSNVMMIEEDNNEQTVLQQPRRVEPQESKMRARPLSTIGGIGMAAAAEARRKRTSELESEKRSASPPPTGTPSGEESNMNTFDREAFGRRSFSEKRKASNGKNKEVVAKVKALREEMKQENAAAQSQSTAGSEQQSRHSGPYKFKPLSLDLSVTSAYQPATPLSITQLPSSPLYLHRATSHKNPPRPSLSSDSNTSSNRHRTLSVTSSSNGVNGKRPVPAPRLSIGSRPDSEYQTIDSSMPDVQITGNIPSTSSSTAHPFLYPEINSQSPPSTKDLGFSRASTLPISAQRPLFDPQLTRSRSKSPDDLSNNNHRHSLKDGSQFDGDSLDASQSSTLDNKSSRNNSRKGVNMKRINSRTSLTDIEKSERRKCDLLESSPYPQLYNLAVEDEAPTYNTSVPSNNTSVVADPIYSQLNKVSGSHSHSTKTGDGKPVTNTAMSFGGQAHFNADDSCNSSGGSSSDINTPLHVGGPSSPIYERIDVVPSLPLDHWQSNRGTHSNGIDSSPESLRGTYRGEGRLFRVGSAESVSSSKHLYDRVAMSKTAAQGEPTGPTLGLKKNSSFESLQAMVEDTVKAAAQPGVYKPPNRVTRGRGCNESFRAAVDRSYIPSATEVMDSDAKQTRRPRPRGQSASVNVDRELHQKVSEENEVGPMNRGPMSSSFSAGEIDSEKKKGKKSKNGGGILGLFRLTKARKSLEERSSKPSLKHTKSEEKERSSSVSQASKSNQDADRIQDYYKRLQEKQKTQIAESYNQQPDFGTYPRGDRLRINPPAAAPPPVPPHANSHAKAEQLAGIRAQHQRRHNERQGQYPTDAKDDFYERKIREREMAVNNRAYGTGAEFNPRHKSSQLSGMSNSVPNRASFYADPRYHDYHRSTQPGYYPHNDHNSNIHSQYPGISASYHSTVANQIDAYNNSLPRIAPSTNNSDYAAINKTGRSQGHQRIPSYDSSSAPFHNSLRQDVILDYDDPQGAENSLYARVRKQPAVGHSVTNPARV